MHLQALIYLSKANRYSNTPQALADYLGLTKGTVSQTLLLLDRRGLDRALRGRHRPSRRAPEARRLPASSCSTKSQPALAWQNATRNISPNRIRNAVSGAARGARDLCRKTTRARLFGDCQNCAWCQKLSQRIYRCGKMGDRISGPETRRICRIYEAKTADEAA